MRPLDDSDTVIGEAVIGLHMAGDFDWVPPPVDMISRDTLWHGSFLVVPPPSGKKILVSPAKTPASREAAELLGGPFDRDLTAFMKPLRNLVFRKPDHPIPSLREKIFHDKPGVKYTWLASAFDRWRVQALGAPGDFFFISLFTTLDEHTALEPNGFPQRHPMGDPWKLLMRVAPALASRQLQADTRYETNLYDAVFVADRLRVRMGVRAVSSSDSRRTGEYLYVIRVDTR